MSQTAAPLEVKRPTGLIRKVILGTALGGAVFAALALYGDIHELQKNLGAFAWPALAAAFALAFGNYLLRIVRFQYYLRVIDVRVPWGESALVFLSGFVMSVTPGKVGEAFKSLLLYESHGASIARTIPVTIAERLTDLLALVLLAAIGVLAMPSAWPIALGGAAIVVLGLAACAYRPLGELSLRIADRTPGIRRIAGRLREAYESLYAMTRVKPLVLGTAIALVAWWLEVLSLKVIVDGFPGAELSTLAATFAYAASTIAGAVAMMPGGLGVTEAGMTGLLEALGGGSIGPALASAATMLCRIATLWFAVALGGIALFLHRRLTNRRENRFASV